MVVAGLTVYLFLYFKNTFLKNYCIFIILDCFDRLILKINFKKLKNIYYFDIFLRKNILKNNHTTNWLKNNFNNNFNFKKNTIKTQK